MTEQISASERRLRILEAAERLLKHYGFAKTTVSDIAREAAVGVGTVYLEFSSKDDIIAALSARCHAARLEAMRGRAATATTYASRLRVILEERVRHLARVARDGHHGLDLVRCQSPAVAEVRRYYSAQEELLLAELLLAAHREGEFVVRAPALTAKLLLRLFDSFVADIFGGTSAESVEPELQAAYGLLLDGLLARGFRGRRTHAVGEDLAERT